MKYLTIKAKSRRTLFNKNEKSKIKLRVLRGNLYLNKYIRYLSQLKLNNYARNGSEAQQSRRCVITGKSNSVVGFFKISRNMFRELAVQGKLVGIRKH